MKKIILAVAVAAIATMAVVSSASADVARYQTQSMTITAVQPEGAVGQWTNVWTHTYNVTLNPCDSSFSGTGSITGTINGLLTAPRRSRATSTGTAVSFTASRSFDNVVYSLANAPLDSTTVTLATSTPVGPVGARVQGRRDDAIATTNYKNHGEYVSSQGGGSDAAHSCIGMPIH